MPDDPTTSTTNNPNVSTTADPPADPPAPEPAAKTFSQADLDRIVQDRLARQKAQFGDYEELKAAAGELDALKQASKTELEQAQDRAAKAEADAAAVRDTANARLVEASVIAAATAAKAIKPEHMHKLIDTGQVTVGDDGQVTGAQEAVQAFLDANPEYLVGTRPAGDADLGARGTHDPAQLGEADLKGMTPAQIVEARRAGRFKNLGVSS